MASHFIAAGALSSLLAVALGAFGAHALEDVLDDYAKGIWQTAVDYQMYHSLAVILVGVLQRVAGFTRITVAGWAFLVGIVLFSGSLYVLALTGVKTLGAITPFGGVAFLVGWGWLVYACLRRRESESA